MWNSQNICSSRTGHVVCFHEANDTFRIKAGVRQRCVLSPNFFNSIREHGRIESWRQRCEHMELHLGGGPALLDARFANVFSGVSTDAAAAAVVTAAFSNLLAG